MDNGNTMNPEQTAVGIDLGTTYSVVAYIDHTGRPITINNESGDVLTPSAIFIDEDEIIVGKEAIKASVVAPDLYAECFKRDMGSAAFRRDIRGQKVPPEVCSAFVLERLKHDAQRRLGPFHKAVVTVPAFFDEGRRRLTQNAGYLAGLDVLDIINEPTAAAVAFGRDLEFLNLADPGAAAQSLRILVYDLGGGTFDVTVLEIDGRQFRTLATDGDVRLGGKDFDKRLVEHIAQRFQEQHGVDPRGDAQDAAQLWLDAQEAKHALSERTKTTVVCSHAGIRMRLDISRDEFEEMTVDLLERSETTASLVIRQAGMEWQQLDRVLLVGGATRMPMIRRMLRELSGKEPDCSQSPDEAVAYGAALYAKELLDREAGASESSYELTNVNSHSLGVVGIERKSGQQRNVILIPKNTPLPHNATKMFLTAKADQRSIRVPVVEGESDRPEDCIALGECVIRDLPPGLPPRTKIEVEYRYAANGRLSVLARVPSVRHSAYVEIKRDEQPNQEGLDAWRSRLLGKPGTEAPRFDAAADGAGTHQAEPEAPDHRQTALELPQPGGTRRGGRDDGERRTALELVTPGDETTDGKSIRKRLDALHVRVGKAAVRCRLPEPLRESQQAAAAADLELARAQAALKKSLEAEETTLHDPGALHQRAEASAAKAACDQAKVRAEFTRLVLGRECAASGVIPPGTDEQVNEIHQLQQALQRLK